MNEREKQEENNEIRKGKETKERREEDNLAGKVK
jgi:hypothetical protein